MVATGEGGRRDPLQVLNLLSRRQGFTRCSGRLYATDRVSGSLAALQATLRSLLQPHTSLRTHCHPHSL